jgi:L,D-peptidoglycan transpeptidase YkuD (ErfK/YbiS/YcfS/YnhG family)
MRRLTAAFATLAAAAVVAGALGGTAPAGAAGAPLPARLANVGDARQVVVVTSSGWQSSYARLQTWRRTLGGDWVQVMAPVPARVGWNGMRAAEDRLQSTGTTPAGTFALLRGFGLAKPGGVELPYRQVDANDWWPYDPSDPKTYNVLQPWRPMHAQWRTDWAERLASYRKQYRFAVVLDYNLPGALRWRNNQRIALDTADTRAGGGIFLHVNGKDATAGCISISRARMRQVLQWLDPDLDPVIVVGPWELIEQM